MQLLKEVPILILTFIAFISTTLLMPSSSYMNFHSRSQYNINSRKISIKPFFLKFQQLSHVLVVGISSLSQEVFVFAQVDSDDDKHDDYLAEILAEEEREAEELADLEAQMKELDEMKAQQEQMKRESNNRGGNMNMPPGKTKMSSSGARNKNFDSIQEELLKKEAMSQEKKKEAYATEHAQAKEESQRAKAEKIAREREAAFQAEIERAKDEKTKNDLKRQKAHDAKIVKKILNNGNKENYYAVLGMRCQWGEIQVGPLKFCSVKNSEVKKAYRKMAKLVHPDKNRDGRAEQAFDLLEKSSSILLDEKQRKEYNAKLKLQRKNRFQMGVRTLDDTWNGLIKVLTTLRKVLGPFATPIFVLTALII